MQMVLDKRCGEQHAITDIYCAKRQRSLVSFPVALISLLIISGVAAFLVTGFVGYANCQVIVTPPGGVPSCWHDPWYFVLYLKEPWAIYLWASAVLLAVQIAILRDPSLRRRLVRALIATLASIMIVGLVYLFGDAILRWLQANYKDLLNVVRLPITYTILNFAIIILYLLGSAWRWIRHPDGLKLIGIRSAPTRRKADTDAATLEELISGDLLTGMVLFFVMSRVFTYDFISWFINTTTIAGFLNGSVPHDIGSVPVSLSTTDTVLALLCLFMGFMTLALTALLAGLAVLQGQTDPAASQVAGRVSTEVALTVLNALRAAITRQLRGIVRRVSFTLRRALWPLLLLSGSFCLALFGRYVQAYLHFLDDPTYNCQVAVIHSARGAICAVLPHEASLLLAIGLGLAGVVATILSTALQLRSWRVAVNAFGFLRWVGLVVLITFWIFSVALFAFNILLLQLGVVPVSMWRPASASTCPLPTWYNIAVPLNLQTHYCIQPFVPMSYPTFISFAAFLVVVGILLVRLRQGVVRRVPSPSASTTAHGLPIPRASASVPSRGGVRQADSGR